MQVLQVFDESLAMELKNSGWMEFRTKYNIERQPPWVFQYDGPKAVRFDINEAMKSGKCRLTDRFTMSF